MIFPSFASSICLDRPRFQSCFLFAISPKSQSAGRRRRNKQKTLGHIRTYHPKSNREIRQKISKSELSPFQPISAPHFCPILAKSGSSPKGRAPTPNKQHGKHKDVSPKIQPHILPKKIPESELFQFQPISAPQFGPILTKFGSGPKGRAPPPKNKLEKRKDVSPKMQPKICQTIPKSKLSAFQTYFNLLVIQLLLLVQF